MNVISQEWKTVADIPRFPFETFDELQAAVAIKSFNVGVDPLAAANRRIAIVVLRAARQQAEAP